ncbi:SdpI family protein [Gloeothece verrucosa]|uniref:SdpI family protein n=1 Tax=Gloeothece verrucosa (strain PCC 7822) TaxID=497965 RepID=E0ULF2_GLOV7|nr:SdpI family protein [Gloeothece verrucosa]ADN17782.1 hypothetical protein Cyan7822_5928 [Gloeothece verrucosa PCC 7822]
MLTVFIHQPFFIPEIIINLLSLPLIFKLIPRQGWYGIRTAKTLSNDRYWYSANTFGGRVLFTSTMIYLVVAWTIPCTSSECPDLKVFLIHLTAMALPLFTGMILIHSYLKKL